MILKDFYTLNSLEQQDAENYLCTLTLNSHHPIFDGHFPQNPITPGVCMMQIIKNLTEEITGHKLFLVKTTNVKFMALINPITHPVLTLTLTIQHKGADIQVKNTTSYNDTVALKLTNLYKIQS
ncbi:3-hydroxyacyl-ACP dehydratase [Capnocytophaga sp. HP1101]